MSGKFLTNGRWNDEPQGYVFQCSIYCPSCMIEILIERGDAAPAARGMISVEVLEQISHAAGVDFDDEYSYDSDEFPKVVTNEQGDGSECERCGRLLEDD